MGVCYAAGSMAVVRPAVLVWRVRGGECGENAEGQRGCHSEQGRGFCKRESRTENSGIRIGWSQLGQQAKHGASKSPAARSWKAGLRGIRGPRDRRAWKQCINCGGGRATRECGFSSAYCTGVTENGAAVAWEYLDNVSFGFASPVADRKGLSD